MSRCVVTGSAGFVGSHLCESLVDDGHDVTGIDCFTDNYAQPLKEANLVRLMSSSRFCLLRDDLLSMDLEPVLRDAEYVFHLAGQPGVRESWGSSFQVYAQRNIIATQRLLEAVKATRVKKVLYASSSSVYGDAEMYPTSETVLPKPVSPYGVTKLAGEHLCYLYWKNYGVPVVSVRYFTVYGPRQRPDMGFNLFLEAGLSGQAVRVYGDGEQTRDFTYVDDAIAGTVAAAFSSVCGEVFNLGGGSCVSVNQVLRTVEAIVGRKLQVISAGAQRGDARHTAADITRARESLGFSPRVDLATGLRNQALWIQESRAEGRGSRPGSG